MPRPRCPSIALSKTYLLHCRHHSNDRKDQKGCPHAESRGASIGGLAGIRIDVRHGCLEGGGEQFNFMDRALQLYQLSSHKANPVAVEPIFPMYSPD